MSLLEEVFFSSSEKIWFHSIDPPSIPCEAGGPAGEGEVYVHEGGCRGVLVKDGGGREPVQRRECYRMSHDSQHANLKILRVGGLTSVGCRWVRVWACRLRKRGAEMSELMTGAMRGLRGLADKELRGLRNSRS